VSELGFGCEPLGGTDWGDVDEDSIHRAIRCALEMGVRYFDTAPVYGQGLSEERLSKYLGAERHQVVVGTKVGMQLIASPTSSRATSRITSARRAVFDSVRESLRRLKLSSIPLLFVHYPDPETPIEELVETLEVLKKEGMVQRVGFSNFSDSSLRQIAKLQKIDALQFEYNLLNRSCEKDLLAFAKSNEIPTYSYGVLARGLLSGKFSGDTITFPANDRRQRLEDFTGEKFRRNIALADELRGFAAKYSTTSSAIAIRWLQQYSGISTTITGIKNEQQLRQNWNARTINLTPEDLNAIGAVFS
jgi:aryl-alcohol dehydrogenase-like predicted oxidoreductase